MNIATLARAVGMEPTANPKDIRRAVVQRFEDEAKKAAMAETYNYGEAAEKLEGLAKAYEDAQFEEEGEEEAPHATMRRMATKFRKMAGPFAGEETPGEEAKEALVGMARKLGLPANAGARQIAMAMEARTVDFAQVGTLERRLAELEAQRASELATERKRSALLTFEQAVAEGRTKPEKRDVFVAAFERDPRGAEALLFDRGTFGSREVLMSRMTAAGAPIGADSRSSSGSMLDQRVVTMSALGTDAKALIFGEGLATQTREMADSQDPKVRARIDADLPEGAKGSKYESYERYMAADRILKKERPDLFRMADPHAQ